MSDDGPFGENPFGGIPFFGDLGKILGGMSGAGGGLHWDTVRQVAMQVASGGQSEPNVEPSVRFELAELARVAELHVAQTTGLDTSQTGNSISVLPVNRMQWVQRSLDAYRPLFESLASSLGRAQPVADDTPTDPNDPFGAMLGQLMGALTPMMLGMTAGGMIGHLASRSFGQYDLPVPRKASDELLLVIPNLDEFCTDWSIDAADLRLWVCLHEITHHAVFGVPHVRAALERMLQEYASGFRADPNALVDRMGEIDISNPAALEQLQSTLGDPEVILGAIQSSEQQELLPRLEALVAVIAGYVDQVMDDVGGRLIAGYPKLTEALRRRRVESADSDQFVARLFGLELSQHTYDRGSSFVDGVVERAGFDALSQLWIDARFLPTPAEIDAPGLWLARIEFDATPGAD